MAQADDPNRLNVRRLVEHPISPIVIGAVLSLDTSGDILAKSYAFVFLSIWLAWDICSRWIWKHDDLIIKGKNFKLAASALCFQLIPFVLFFLPLCYLENKKALEEQADVFQSIEVVTPFIVRGMEDLEITIKNNSKQDIETKSTGCRVMGMVFGGTNILGESGQREGRTGLLQRGGDGATFGCTNRVLQLPGEISCVDLRAIITYGLADQIGFFQSKVFRLVGKTIPNRGFIWFKQPVESSVNYCASDEEKARRR